MLKTTFALLFALALAAPVAAQTNTETVDRTLTLRPGGTLRLKTFSGRVRITGGSGDQVVIKAVRRARQDRLDDIKLEITQSGDTIEVDANHRLVERRNDNVVETHDQEVRSEKLEVGSTSHFQLFTSNFIRPSRMLPGG